MRHRKWTVDPKIYYSLMSFQIHMLWFIFYKTQKQNFLKNFHVTLVQWVGKELWEHSSKMFPFVFHGKNWYDGNQMMSEFSWGNNKLIFLQIGTLYIDVYYLSCKVDWMDELLPM